MREAARGEERAEGELEAARKVVEAARLMGGGGALQAALATYDAIKTPNGV